MRVEANQATAGISCRITGLKLVSAFLRWQDELSTGPQPRRHDRVAP